MASEVDHRSKSSVSAVFGYQQDEKKNEKSEPSGTSLDRPVSLFNHQQIDLSHLFISEELDETKGLSMLSPRPSSFDTPTYLFHHDLKKTHGVTGGNMESIDEIGNCNKEKLLVGFLVVVPLVSLVLFYWRLFEKGEIQGKCLDPDWSSSKTLVMETLFHHCECVPEWMEESAYFDPSITLYLATALVVIFLVAHRVMPVLSVLWRWCWNSSSKSNLLQALGRYHGLPESNRDSIRRELKQKFPSIPDIKEGTVHSNSDCSKAMPGCKSTPRREWFEWFASINGEKGDLLAELVVTMTKLSSSTFTSTSCWQHIEKEWKLYYPDMPQMFELEAFIDDVRTSEDSKSGEDELIKLCGVEFSDWLSGAEEFETVGEFLLEQVEFNERTVREEAERSDLVIFFALQLLLGFDVLFDYYALQVWPSGNFLCRWTYFSSSVMYKPFMIPMWFCVIFSCHYAFSDQLFRMAYRDPKTGTPLGAPFRRGRFSLVLVSGVTVLQLVWLIPTLPVILPLVLLFLPLVVLPAVVLPLVCVYLLQKGLDIIGSFISLKFRFFALQTMLKDGMKLENLSNSLRADRTVVLAAVKNNGKALQHALGNLKGDKELLMLALPFDIDVLEHAPRELTSDFDFIFQAVSIDGLALRYAAEELKFDKEVVSMAVMQNGRALQYAPESLRDDEKIALYAVEQCGLALEYVSNRLKDDPEVVEAALHQDRNAQVHTTRLPPRYGLDPFQDEVFGLKHSGSVEGDKVSDNLNDEVGGGSRRSIPSPKSFGEAIFVVQASATQLVSVVVLSFLFLPLYEHGFGWWWHGADHFLSAIYHLPTLSKQLEDFFTYPNFEQERLNIQLAIGLMLVALFAIIRSGKWLFSVFQLQDRMESAEPGKWETLLMFVFSLISWRILREPVDIASTSLAQCTIINNRKDKQQDAASRRSPQGPRGIFNCWSCSGCVIGSRVKVFKEGATDADVLHFTSSEEAASYRCAAFAKGNRVTLKAFGMISTNCPWMPILSVTLSNMKGDLHSFCGLQALQYLDLSHCEQLTGDLSSLSSLHALSHLNLSYCPHVYGELSSIASLVSLKHVNLAYCELITGDLGDLAPLIAIKYIHLTGSVKVTVLWKGIERQPIGAVKRLLSAGAYPNCITAHGFSPLHGAATSGFVDILASIIDVERGFVASTELRHQHTPLHCASLKGRISCISFLIDRGADVTLVDKDKYTALHFAARGGFASIVELLLERGAKVNAVNKDAATPLHLAAMNGHADCVSLLLNSGGDANMTDNKSWVALHYAARHGHTTAAKLLLFSWKNINIGDKRKWTFLHLAGRYGHTDMAAMLIEKGADIHCMSINGSSPLHFAAANGHINTVAKLIALGADREVVDKQQWTPAHHAAFNHHDSIVALLHVAQSNPYVDIEEEVASRPRPSLETDISKINNQSQLFAYQIRSHSRPEISRSTSGLRSRSTPRPRIKTGNTEDDADGGKANARAPSVSRSNRPVSVNRTNSNLSEKDRSASVGRRLSRSRSQLHFSKIPGGIRDISQSYVGFGAAI